MYLNGLYLRLLNIALGKIRLGNFENGTVNILKVSHAFPIVLENLTLKIVDIIIIIMMFEMFENV